MAGRGAVRQKPVVSQHTLQLFDTVDSLGPSVASFLATGSELNQTLLVVSIQPHWEAIAAALGTTLLSDPERAISGGRLTVLEASTLLSQFMRRGQPNRALFRQTVGALVARLASGSARGLRIYGEMVEVLARDGNYAAASRLEELWNELGTEHPFTLLCGYSSAHFAGPDGRSALASICCRHSRAFSHAHDPLGQFLLASEPSRGAASV